MKVLRALAVAAIVLAPAPALAQRPSVLVATVDGPITPVVAGYLEDAVEEAEANHQALLIEMDTPGGLDTSMRDIVKDIVGADVPVIVYVTPSGARAASAGAIIALASHVVAMAPGTNIGAATPVSLQEGVEVGDKVVNDAAAYAASLAELRGRNERVAREFVTKGRSEPAARAVELNVADLVAGDREDVLDHLEATRDAEAVPFDIGFLRRVRQWLADPNIAFLFMSLGTLAIVYELANPGIGFGGIVGVILLVLGLFSLAVLPVSAVGIVLLILAAGLFVAELFAPGVGVFAAGGSVSLVLAGLFLFRGSLSVDLGVILPVAVVVGLLVVIAGRLVWRSRRAPSPTGAEGYAGRTVQLDSGEGTRGRVRIDGTWWNVRSAGPALAPGQPVRVTGMEGLTLLVEPIEEEERA